MNFRAYDELASCLTALERYLADDLEVIVVDHASEPAAASSLLNKFPWMRFIQTEANPGFAAGVNRAFGVSEGNNLLLLNPDCIVHGDVPHELASWLGGHPRVGAAGALVREADGSVQASARRFPGVTTVFAGRSSWLTRRWPQNRWTRRNLVAREPGRGPIEVDWISGACMMIRREAFESVGGFDERFFLYWEDADFCFRLRRAGWSVFYNPGASVTHLTGRSSARARRQSLIAFHRSVWRYFRKNSGFLAQAAAPLVFVGVYTRLAMKLVSVELQRVAKRKP